MDSGTFWIVLIALLALVAVGAFVVYRRKADVEIRGPLGTGLSVKGSNEEEKAQPQPGVRASQLRSRSGGALVEDRTGRGADVEDVEVEQDILISSEGPKDERPKA